MFGIGGFELFLILLFGFLVFGPDKLPEIAQTLGKAIKKFKTAQDEMNKVIRTEVYDPTSDEPFKDPVNALNKLGEAAEKGVLGLTGAGSSQTSSSKKNSGQSKTTQKSHVSATESFSERKARYDRERAAKKAAEQKSAEAGRKDTAKQTAEEKDTAKRIVDKTTDTPSDVSPEDDAKPPENCTQKSASEIPASETEDISVADAAPSAKEAS